jgi:hypothetical protein
MKYEKFAFSIIYLLLPTVVMYLSLYYLFPFKDYNSIIPFAFSLSISFIGLIVYFIFRPCHVVMPVLGGIIQPFTILIFIFIDYGEYGLLYGIFLFAPMYFVFFTVPYLLIFGIILFIQKKIKSKNEQ